MKVAIRVRVTCLAALATLAAPAALADEPSGGMRYPIQRTSHYASVAQVEADGSLDAEPEPTEAPREYAGGEMIEGLTPWENAGPGYGETCDDCGGDCGGTCSRGCLGGLWFGSVDYLLFRPRFSQAVAEVNRVESTDESTTPFVTTLTDTVIEYPFKYQSGFRVTAGYRLLDCGGDFQVGYWRMTTDAQYRGGPADISNNDPFIAGNLENNPGNDEFLNSYTGVTANIIDADFGKCISMGGPCGPCDPCGCPRWDLRFFVGARAGDISRYNNNVVVTADGDNVSYGKINARFVGAGPRVGIRGRRYFGPCGHLSLYAKGSQALLIGDYRMSRTLRIPGEGTITPTQVTNQYDLFHRMIPVTDIEIGGTWQMAPYTFVSVGYFFQCWWDLGQGEQIQGTNFGGLDSANILGFDGLFVRGEMLF